MLGGETSKKRGEDASQSPPHTFTPGSQYMADLTSYEAACQVDPDLRAFDHTLYERTTRVINTLAVGVEVRSLSFDSLREVTSSLLEMNQEVVKVILECKKDIWNNHQLFALVEDYFENSLQTLDFCASLERCLKKVKDNQLIIHFAIKYFDEETGSVASAEGKRYVKTLEELRRFKAAGEPFTEEFFVLFQSVYKQQLAMLEKLQLRKRKLDRKLKSAKAWTRVSNVIFVAALVSALIFSVVAAAMAAPPLITALAGAISVPIGSVGKWCNTFLKNYQSMIKAQRGLVSSMQVGTYVAIKDMDSIQQLVNRLEIEILALVESAHVPGDDDDDDVAMKLAIEEIKKRLALFIETAEDLGKGADKCSREIRMARTVVLQRMIKPPNS
ncbi:hypothetical protein SAY87_020366 [Trapa incisa]|uniref:Uncharacterized protein n=2 Tax=Trapa TaxID=22665 RepID=A0AAN7M6Z8_TRANT|nr:hypothetical protein SAY87_020366 [Trapa incisa]KAK4792952.1 hypothetical protein SAY86_023387 [Trapa natans]